MAHVVPGIGHEASGPSYSVPRLARGLAERGNDVSLHVLDWETTPAVPHVDVTIYPLLPVLPNLGLSWTMPWGLRRAAHRVDLVHNHGLWMAPNVLAWAATVGTGARLVVSPRGVFAPAALARSRVRKRVMWVLGQGAAVRGAALLHATSEAEAADIRRAGLRAPVVILPNGIDLPRLVAADRPPGTLKRLLFLGRLHPIKGIDRLLRAWSMIARRFPDWELLIVGPDEGGYGARLQALATELQLERASFRGPLFGEEKTAGYAAADLFVLPSHTENFGMTVAEALASGVPAIVTKGAPWEGLEIENCGWWIEHGHAPLADTLSEAMSLPDADRQGMGRRGRAWMARDFAWEDIAAKMEAAYLWTLGRGSRPDWVLSS